MCCVRTHRVWLPSRDQNGRFLRWCERATAYPTLQLRCMNVRLYVLSSIGLTVLYVSTFAWYVF